MGSILAKQPHEQSTLLMGRGYGWGENKDLMGSEGAVGGGDYQMASADKIRWVAMDPAVYIQSGHQEKKMQN